MPYSHASQGLPTRSGNPAVQGRNREADVQTNVPGSHPARHELIAGSTEITHGRLSQSQPHHTRLIRDSGVLRAGRSTTPAGPCPSAGRCARTRRTPGMTATAPARSPGAAGTSSAAATTALQRVDVDLAEPVAVLITGE